MTVQLSADLWGSFLPDTLSASIGTLIGAAVAAVIAYWIYRRELEHRRTERLNDALAKVIEAVDIEEAAFDELIPTAPAVCVDWRAVV
ncbi:UNVERIFIED_ORG: glycerol uptake facilitator-like aquaporin [Arthrobacter sp. UYCu721]